jgi:5-methylcytosine-specific restriction endonuclease McrA
MDASLARDVRERARHVCEYCRMPESNYSTVPFPIDHVIARQHGGSTTLENRALSCLHDNTRKSAEGAIHFVAPTSACTRSCFTSTGRAFGGKK